MSTYWGYRCLDCDKETDTWINHGETALNEYFEVRRLTRKTIILFYIMNTTKMKS
jgi:hypothetical protein